MTSPTVLVDGSQILKRDGTGITSYARTLARNLDLLGANVGLLFGSRVKKYRSDPAIAMTDQVFGNITTTDQFFGQGALDRSRFLLHLRSLIGLKRIRTEELEMAGIELRALEPQLPPFARAFNGFEALSHAESTFAIWRRLAVLDTPDEFAAVHWTAPTPMKGRHGPNIYTLHDLVPLQFPYLVLDRPGYAARLHAAIARDADHIITVSEKSKEHIVDMLGVSPEDVSVTYQPVPELPPVSREESERLVATVYGAKPGSYALFLGAIEPKKNLMRLIEAFLQSGVNIPLLLAGPLGWLYEQELDLIDIVTRLHGEQGATAKKITKALLELEAADARHSGPEEPHRRQMTLQSDLPVRHLGFLPRRHVTALLQCAKFFVFPSVYEGFGLPALEALQAGVPVLTSRTASLPEIVGDAAILVDPISVTDIAAGIRRLDADADMRSEFARRGPVQAEKFSDDAYQHRLVKAYARVGVSFPKSPAKKTKWSDPNTLVPERVGARELAKEKA